MIQDGTFIVRDSTKIKGEYSLSLWFGGGVRHLRYSKSGMYMGGASSLCRWLIGLFYYFLYRIRLRADKKFVLGEEKSDELVRDPLPTTCQHPVTLSFLYTHTHTGI